MLKTLYIKYFKIIKKHHPNVNVEKIKIIEDGWDHFIFLVNQVVFKFPRRKEYYLLLETEAKFLAVFSKYSPLKVPEMKFYEDQQSKIVYVIYKFIKGTPFVKNLYHNFTSSQRVEITYGMGSFLSTLHAFPVNKASDLGIPNEDLLTLWKRKIDYSSKKITPYLNEKEKVWAKNLFQKFLNLIAQVEIEVRVIHFDLYQSHILVDPNKHTLSGVIDFADMRIGDPAYDFHELGNYYGEDFLKNVLKGYQLIKDQYFYERLKFYQSRWYLMEVEFAADNKSGRTLKEAKNSLRKYIKNGNYNF